MDLNNNKMLIQKAVPKLRVKIYATVLNLEFSFKSSADSKWPSVNRFQPQSES
jgi:hypothetical protein